MTNEHTVQPDSEPVVQTHITSSESASEAIIRALAVVKDVKPTESTPLYDSVDTEALDALLDCSVPEAKPPIVVGFVTSGYRVVVSSEGQITILDR